MLRSMYAGISGLKNFQTKLDVIGNNISNVNTYGFKKGRTIFSDLYSQTVSGASGSTTTRGGVNPKQVGLGSQLAAIDTLHSPGSTQFTGQTLDLAIEGDGFFMVVDQDTGIKTNQTFTRAGNFYLDKNGALVDGNGKYLAGAKATVTGGVYPDAEGSPTISKNSTSGELSVSTGATLAAPITIPNDAQSMSIGNDGKITFVDAEGKLKYAGQLVMAKFSNPGGLTKSGNNYFIESSNSGVPNLSTGGANGVGVVKSGSLEMSNVDLSEEFTEMIVAQRGFQANTRIITTSDEILQELVNLKR
ncbi:flagellar basal body rod protein FlgG [Sporosarcina trichiuri]|uniref:flagellar basal body rod protein FlgG n=1 Tax=Sporosarcina trichiuri TaxID=3056445 RepID=UPI0025B2FAFA|nr:flagellar basal body rod protein FlgG [Sporosarcina sp. 0.2-SM1T-5]WJY28732.1 flagellar basal body rod protein FlgG [Sporosarcina sp. 0.2-SM1T-5]